MKHMYLYNYRALLERKEEAYQNKGVITSLPVQQNIAAGNTNGSAILGAGKIAVLEAECKESKVGNRGLFERLNVKNLR